MSKVNNQKNEQDIIVKRLDAIISILLNQSNIKDHNQKEKINYLTKLKFTNAEIAFILNTSVESIESQKYRK